MSLKSQVKYYFGCFKNVISTTIFTIFIFILNYVWALSTTEDSHKSTHDFENGGLRFVRYKHIYLMIPKHNIIFSIIIDDGLEDRPIYFTN